MATVLDSWVHDDQQPRREDTSGLSLEVEQKVEWRVASSFPEIAKPLLENRSWSRKERWSRLEASGQQSWQDYRRNGNYSGGRGGHPIKHQRKKVFMYRCTSLWREGRWQLSYSTFLPNFCLHCFNIFLSRQVSWSSTTALDKKYFSKKNLGKCVVLVDLFSDLFIYFSDFGFPGKMCVRGKRVWSNINVDELGRIC